MSHSIKNVIIIIESLSIILILIYYFTATEEGKSLFKKEELSLEDKYKAIENKSIDEMTPEEWTISNLYNIEKWKKEGSGFDTMSYEEAMARTIELREQMAEELNPCTEEKLINAFHEIMEFNMPNDLYEKNKIKWKFMGECTIHINVYTKEPKYGWKTFWVFEVQYNKLSEKYQLQVIKKEFIG